MNTPHNETGFDHELVLALTGFIARAVTAGTIILATVALFPAKADTVCVPGSDSFYEAPECMNRHNIGDAVAPRGEPGRVVAKSNKGRVAILSDAGQFEVIGEPVQPELWIGRLEDEL